MPSVMLQSIWSCTPGNPRVCDAIRFWLGCDSAGSGAAGVHLCIVLISDVLHGEQRHQLGRQLRAEDSTRQRQDARTHHLYFAHRQPEPLSPLHVEKSSTVDATDRLASKERSSFAESQALLPPIWRRRGVHTDLCSLERVCRGAWEYGPSRPSLHSVNSNDNCLFLGYEARHSLTIMDNDHPL